MNDEKEKYSNGKSLDASKMSKEEKLKAIEYWCEGNQQLKKLLLHLNENEIDTIGCCSGHDNDSVHKDESAYIAIKLGTPKDDDVINLLTLLDEKKRKMKIGFVRGNVEKYFCVLCALENRL